MAKNVISNSKEFAKLVTSANKELNGTFKSPFVICNLLNKAAKGDFSKVANCEDLTKDNLSKVAKVVKTLHTNRYAFDICILPKSEIGKLGTFVVVNDMQSELSNILCGEIVYYCGRELSVNCGKVGYFRAIPLTINGMFNAFAKVAKVDISTKEKEAKEAQREAKKRAKEYENAKKCIIRDYNNGMFGENILAEKLATLRTKYGK